MPKRIELKDTRVIKTRDTTDAYRDGWERIFAKDKDKTRKPLTPACPFLNRLKRL